MKSALPTKSVFLPSGEKARANGLEVDDREEHGIFTFKDIGQGEENGNIRDGGRGGCFTSSKESISCNNSSLVNFRRELSWRRVWMRDWASWSGWRRAEISKWQEASCSERESAIVENTGGVEVLPGS